MKTEVIQKQISSLEDKKSEIDKKISSLKIELSKESDKTEWIYIPELKIEIQTKIHHKGKSYDELVKEFGKEYLEKNLPTYAQLQFLRNSNKYKETLGLIDTWEFVKQEDEISKKNNYIARFVAYSGYADLYCFRYSINSNSTLGVRFVRKKIIKKSKNDKSKM
jgi:hypothetical protein